MAEALHIDRDRLILSPPTATSPSASGTWSSAAPSGEPVAYITGRRAFWNIDLHVGPGVLVPRPNSEVLIASAIEHFEGDGRPGAILDLGTGPGTLLACRARHLAGRHRPRHRRFAPGVVLRQRQRAPPRVREPRAHCSQGNWADGVVENFDLILCNPPYVADGLSSDLASREYRAGRGAVRGRGGLDAYRALAPQLPRLLNPGGLAAIEIGPIQATAVVGRSRPRRARRRVAHDLGGARTVPSSYNVDLNKFTWQKELRALHNRQDRARSRSAAERIPCQPPTQSLVR